MAMEQHGAELDLRAYLRILWRRKWIVALATVIVVGVALGSSVSKTKLYRASAQILIARTAAETYFDPIRGAYVDPQRALANQIQVIQSEPVRKLVEDRLGFPAGVSTSSSETEDIVTLTAIDPDPARAARIANTYTDAYIDYRKQTEQGGTEAAIAELGRQIVNVQSDLDALDVAAQGNRGNDSQEAALQRQQLVNQLSDLRNQLTQLQAAANVSRGGAQILQQAQAPGAPFEPTPRRTGVLALAVGLMLGVGLAFLIDFLDDRIRTKDDLERASEGLPVLGLIPNVRAWKNKKDAQVISVVEPESSPAEAYRSLRTSVQFLGLDRPLRLMQVTSPTASEGKTTTIANLAVALSRAGQRVIVVCCDLRRPRIHQFFDLDNRVGFTTVLLGDAPLSAALQDVPGLSNLRLLASGEEPPNPSELLSSNRTIDVLTTLQADADIVLVDSPPVLPVSDAAVLSTRVDATLLVTNANDSTRKQVHRAIEVLKQVDAQLIGAVLNGVGEGAAYAYGYGYGYRAGSTKAKSPAPIRS